MVKPIIFISHITEEKELAINIKELIENSFLGMMDVFVSSDESSIALGQKWLDNITSSLKTCSVELILCSPKSVKRPWINFEAGAGWIRGIPIIPMCHSGMEPAKLPIPLNLLQATKISEISNLKLIFPVLANAIDAKIPNIDFTDFIDKVTKFERKYMLGDNLKDFFQILNGDIAKVYNELNLNPGISTLLLDVGFVENDKIKKLESLVKNELRGYIEIDVKFSGTAYSGQGSVIGSHINILIKDVNVLREFKNILS